MKKLIAQLKRDGCSAEQIASVVEYETRVRALEAQGVSRSDAQGIVDAEELGSRDKHLVN